MPAVGLGLAAVELDALDERTGAVAYANDGDTDFSHGKKEILPAAVSLGQDAKWLSWKVKAGNDMSGFVRGENLTTIWAWKVA